MTLRLCQRTQVRLKRKTVSTLTASLRSNRMPLVLHKLVSVLLLAIGLVAFWVCTRSLAHTNWTHAGIALATAAVFAAAAAGLWRLSRANG